MPASRAPFADRLAERMTRVGTRLVVGIDPEIGRLPAALQALGAEEALIAFSRGVIDATADRAAAFKPQAAFFERYGWRGMRALQKTVEHAAGRGVPVILDAKRGDIGSTARAYAEAYLGDDPETPGPFVDAITVNPYLGGDSLEPFIARATAAGRGLFVLARTSNPGSAELQELRTPEEPLYLAVARAAERWGSGLASASGYTPIGLVAGATWPRELAEIRAAAPRSVLLIPGVGAQGGSVADCLAAFDAKGTGALIAASRAVIYAYEKDPERGAGDWTRAVARAATQLAAEIEQALASRR